MTFIAAVAGAVAPLGSAIFFLALTELSEDFHAFKHSPILLWRGSAASFLAIGTETIADIWEPKKRGRATGIFFLSPMLGQFLAPIIVGEVAKKWGWRSTQWFQTIYGELILILLLFCLPETLARRTPVVEELAGGNITSHRANFAPLPTSPSIQHRMKRVVVILKKSITDQLKILGYLQFPAIGRSCYIFTGFVGGKRSDAIMHGEARAAGRLDGSGKLILRPEDRMRENVLLAAAIYPAGLLWFGWTAEKRLHWIVPLMLTEFLPKRSSCGVAPLLDGSASSQFWGYETIWA
ncbi:uncharacterized protein EAE98_003793 [Botrytis deweyae]|uniref:Major facilitator superfamily (MFS) profile domain-containing protein n=1 Tax=Botrytis deweyae TaxID=2478750 RepID=A0ABQ7IRR3_9HELO|nr:uncharacterized protein EAE98_003793 [Botrytis deweyae]KAF7932494.1 hypothetical protein EAE98_003793 [Botrytis deweyae]